MRRQQYKSAPSREVDSSAGGDEDAASEAVTECCSMMVRLDQAPLKAVRVTLKLVQWTGPGASRTHRTHSFCRSVLAPRATR